MNHETFIFRLGNIGKLLLFIPPHPPTLRCRTPSPPPPKNEGAHPLLPPPKAERKERRGKKQKMFYINILLVWHVMVKYQHTLLCVCTGEGVDSRRKSQKRT